MKLAVLAAALLTSATIAAHAQDAQPGRPPCAPQAEITKGLGQRYGEIPAAAGLLGDGTMLQVYATPDGRTFTLVVAKPDGSACVVSAGQSWATVHPKLPGEPA